MQENKKQKNQIFNNENDMEINHIIQGQVIKIGKAIKIINNIRIISLTNGDITKIMDFTKQHKVFLLP